MEKRFYTATTLKAELRRFEAAYGWPSGAFYRAYERDDVADVSPFDCVVWADTYREFLRMSKASPPVSAPQPVH